MDLPMKIGKFADMPVDAIVLPINPKGYVASRAIHKYIEEHHWDSLLEVSLQIKNRLFDHTAGFCYNNAIASDFANEIYIPEELLLETDATQKLVDWLGYTIKKENISSIALPNIDSGPVTELSKCLNIKVVHYEF